MFLRVMVVEDDDAIREFLVDACTDEGYEVRDAANGRRALEILAVWRPDVIVLDLFMPEMDGWEFRDVQRDHADLRDVPVVVVSASQQLRPGAVDDGVAAMMAKPLRVEALIAVIEQVVTASRAAGTVEP